MIQKGSFFGPEIEVLINNLTNHHSLGAILISFDLPIYLLDVRASGIHWTIKTSAHSQNAQKAYLLADIYSLPE
jgi:hypothetical protein